MKPLFIKTIIVFVILVSSLSTYAQDYVITVNGDSIPCKLRFPALPYIVGSILPKGYISNHARYKAKGMKDYKPISASEIKEYSFDDEFVPGEHIHFRAVYDKQRDTIKFMQVLESGKIRLYQIKKNVYGPLSNFRAVTTNNLPPHGIGSGYGQYVGPDDWFISKGNDTVNMIKTNDLTADESRKERKDELAEMLKDNETVYDKYIKENSFGLEAVRNAIHLYNTGKSYKDKLVDW